MLKLSPVEICQLRLRCAEVALIAVSKVDITKDEGLTFAEKVWEFMEKPLKGNDKALS